MTYYVVAANGEVLCESNDMKLAHLAAQWFRAKGETCSVQRAG